MTYNISLSISYERLLTHFPGTQSPTFAARFGVAQFSFSTFNRIGGENGSSTKVLIRLIVCSCKALQYIFKQMATEVENVDCFKPEKVSGSMLVFYHPWTMVCLL
jgi:hypothetical protein